MKLKTALINFAVLVVTLVVTLLTVEGVLGAFAEHRLPRVLPEVRYTSHPVRWYTLLPDQRGYTYGAPFRVSPSGFRANGLGERQCVGKRIVALGDSFTFGMGVADHETWPAYLEKEIQESVSSSTCVVNAGIVGYGTFQIEDLISEKRLFKDTDLAVYALYWNDYMTTAPPQANDQSRISEHGYFRWDPINRLVSGEIGWLNRWLDKSIVVSKLKLARNRFLRPSNYAVEFNKLLTGQLDELSFQPVNSALSRIKRRADTANVNTFVIILPVYDLLGTATNYNSTIRALLEELGIPYLDAFELFDNLPNPKQYFLPEKVDVHLNSDGYGILARRLYQSLTEQELL